MAPNTVALTVDDARLEGELVVPPAASAIVLFVPGDGICGASPCYAEVVRGGGLPAHRACAVCDL